MYAKSPLYLQYLQSGYTFRFSLPKHVRSKINRAGIKFSLRTHFFAKARNYSRLYALFMERMGADIRTGSIIGAMSLVWNLDASAHATLWYSPRIWRESTICRRYSAQASRIRDGGTLKKIPDMNTLVSSTIFISFCPWLLR